MTQGVQDVFRYSVELDTQGLSQQLAAVRDTIAGGLSSMGRTAVGTVETIGGATNRLSGDLMMGQQMLAAAVPAQMPMSLSPLGAAGTTLASVPGMPQTFGQELMAGFGVTRPPVGVFQSQFEAIGRQRLNERAQNAAGGVLGMAGSIGAGLAGAAVGQALIPIPIVGGLVGGIAGSLLGDAAMAPVLGDVQERMMERARLTQIFGFNKFSDAQRSSMTDFMRQQAVKSIFSPEEFNAVLPSAVRAGFMRGVSQGDVAGFRERFRMAEQTLTQDMFSLQLSGAEGIQTAGALRGAMRKLGVRDVGRASQAFSQARVLAQEMSELGEFTDPTELVQDQLEVGQMAAQMGVSPQRMMDLFASRASTVNRLVATRALDDDDVAMLGGTREAAQRLTLATAATARQPVFRAMALAFGETNLAGKVGVNHAALESIGAGRMSFSALAERMSQQMGTGAGATTRMLSLLANQQKLQGDMMQHQGAMLHGMTDDILKQSGMEVTEDTRRFIMQRVFGVGEAESKALVAGLPMEKADRERLDRETVKFDQEVKGAIQTAQSGTVRDMAVGLREMKEALARPLDSIAKSISDSVAPPLKSTVERLESIDRRLAGTTLRSNSPISAGPIIQGATADRWMIPEDPMHLQGFRSVQEARVYPKPLLPSPMSTLPGPLMVDRRIRETMAN